MNNKNYLSSVYRESLALMTDLYELTMAYGYWKKGIADKEAVFHLFFRRKPFNGSFAVAAGLATVLDYLDNFRFQADDLAYLATLKTDDGNLLFEKKFLDYLRSFSFSCDIDAIPEGTPVFPYEPLVRVQGPLLHAQLLESALLNILNFQTLIATKAARICWAARPDPVVEFGLRRAQGVDGALSASRAAFIGGCESTSNVLAGKIFNIPVKGTHAHSWIMAFDDEEESFVAYAEAMPNNCIFLIDTYDTVGGVKKAINVARRMRERGKEMIGVRLDSGDLAHLSIEVRKLLDEAGFPKAKIMASNELDEHIINDLKHQGAKINIWGVGTNLITGKDQPALDGVYKLSAIKDQKGKWQNKVKISEQLVKVTNPGILQVRRYFDARGNVADMIYDIHAPLAVEPQIIDTLDPMREQKIFASMQYKDLLIPVVRQGKKVYESPSLSQIREKTYRELSQFHPGMRRFLYPQPYLVGLEKSLNELKLKLIQEILNK
ncbi:MAG TPA: nicotinate phosphoribosyltransferase [Rhabdochlamydiaceae bacterium]|nr:nicotinate phosphoribosyltransferase [Rhabdochlamydiaceae bacterium]